VGRARITQFMARGTGPHGDPFTRYEGLYDWSVRQTESFWSSVWEFCEIRGNRGGRVLADADKMPGARWFPDAEVNVAENLLRRGDAAPAIVSRREDAQRRVLTFAALRAEVARLQAALRSAGIRSGDRVAAWLPNAPEAAVAFLAVASLGATWVACAPDLDAEGLAARLRPLEPRALFASDGWLLGGRWTDRLGPLRAAAAALPSLERVVVLPWASSSPDLSGLRGGVDWRAFAGSAAAGDPAFERFPFAHPLGVLFAPPGTGPAETGVVYGSGGTLLQVLAEHQLHADLHAGESLLFLATTDEAAWPWAIAALGSGATLVLYDGHPLRPGAGAVLDAARDEGVSVLGVPALYLDVIERAGLAPAARRPLPRLRAVLASGAPLAGERYDYVYGKVKPDVQLVPLLGGADLVTHFALGAPILPVRRGEVPCRALGLRVEVADPTGRSVTGEPGDLVCRGPFPAMPLGLVGDPDGSRFRAAYFERPPGAWHAGERCTLTEDGSLVA
ncbi:MAG: AMP-binding protein, partial [Planctomycetales bacterium]|nr:AMP-binding protein [Planctomycetales bacterium]